MESQDREPSSRADAIARAFFVRGTFPAFVDTAAGRQVLARLEALKVEGRQ